MATETHGAAKVDHHKLSPVLFGMLLVGLPLYAQLSWLVLWFVLVFTLWGMLIIRGSLKPPGAWLRFVLVLLIVGALLMSYGAVFGLIPGTSMVILLSYLKLFESRNCRDVAVIVFLGLFLSSTIFFHSQSMWVTLYVFGLVIYFAGLLVMISDRSDSLNTRERLRISARMVLQSLPLMLILFVLFPRIPGPLWGLPKDALSATTGLSDEMTPGNINKLVASYNVVFRVKFETSPPENHDLYWRGLVLSDYDGRTWRRDDAPPWTRPELVSSVHVDDEIRYRVTLEPHQHDWLYALEYIASFDNAYAVTRELQLLTKDRISNVTSYNASASPSAVNRALYPPERDKNLELPAGFNPGTLELGRKLLREAHGNARDIAGKALRYFSEQEFFYTLSPPLLGENAMDDFLFISRRGFCEHYASAFVVLMRAAGIPARVILGYQGGEMNPLDEYMIVRQSDAHAWAEIWVDDTHWVRVDPTTAVAPQRIERGIQNAGLEPQFLPRMLLIDTGLLKRARYAWDSLQNTWNQWVIGFDENRQLELFRWFGVEHIDRSQLVLWLVVAMSAAALPVAWWVIRGNSSRQRDRVRKAYTVFTNKLSRRGIEIRAQDTPQELLEKIRHRLPGTMRSAALIIRQYQMLVYGQARTRESEKGFVKTVRRFRP